MRQTWRWFGPEDRVGIDDMRQAGVEGVVSALHHIASGEVWSAAEIARRQAEIATAPDGSDSGLRWEVVESLPVSEAIKKQRGDWRTHLEHYNTSLRNLADAGIEVICYNFMPVLDWTRTSLRHRLPSGARCMRFDHIDFALFDLHLLQRHGAQDDWSDEVREQAAERNTGLSDTARQSLIDNIVCGLPGAAEHMRLEDVRAHLAEYDGIDAERLRQHHRVFLEETIPVAESLGLRLCCHPDDPPFSLLGLPRIVSTEDDYRQLVEAVASPANGITLCSGSLGARADNDLPGMMKRLGQHVHFLHLRNVRRETADRPGSFHESEHLGGDTDMVALLQEVVAEEARRRADGRADHSIPMRPDHGQDILDDLHREGQPGYPAIGRLRGLAELRGIYHALTHRSMAHA